MSDYTPIFEEFVDFFADSSPQDKPRRQCFDVHITDDDISEDMESLRLSLILDPFELHKRIQVNQNVTEIFILDTDKPMAV